MNTHDKYALPPLPAPPKIGFLNYVKHGKKIERYGQDCMRTAIKPYAKRIAELESQLEAIGAGGVSSQKITSPSRGEAVANCWSNDGGDNWLDHPAESDFVDGLKVGDEYELLASVSCWTERFRVIKAPDETSDDYEVEPVSIRTAPQPADPDYKQLYEQMCERYNALDAKLAEYSEREPGYRAIEQAVPLTDERIRLIWKETLARMGDGGDPVIWFARAIERAHGIPAPQPAEMEDPNTSPLSDKGPFKTASELIDSINEPVEVPSGDGEGKT